MASNPNTPQVVIPWWRTNLVIQNNTDTELRKIRPHNQPVFEPAPDTIPAFRTAEFKDYHGNSVGIALYEVVNKGAVWSILWNAWDDNNVVYTKILKVNPGEEIDREGIISYLENADNSSFDHNAGLWAYTVIDKTGWQPTLTAVIGPDALSSSTRT